MLFTILNKNPSQVKKNPLGHPSDNVSFVWIEPGNDRLTDVSDTHGMREGRAE